MKKINIDAFVQVPERIVIEAAEAIADDDNSSFRVVLRAADEYRAANMTPVFILDRYNMDIMCVAAETFGKKLH